MGARASVGGRLATAAAALGLTLGLAACATLATIGCEVSSFGDWPAERAPGTYAFERLPSQQTRPGEAEQMESLARPALERAGFRPAPEGQPPEVLVQLGARSTRSDPGPWDDPLWWHGGFGSWRPGPWPGPGWGWSVHLPAPRYEREVAVLIRDRASGRPLFEARASHEGAGRGDATLLATMFRAALADFPKTGPNPRMVRVEIGR